MKKTSLLLVVAIALMLIQCGCGGVTQSRTGFLSDYSRLKAVSDENYRYVDERAIDRYSGFIVDEVKVHFFAGASAIKAKSKGKIQYLRIQGDFDGSSACELYNMIEPSVKNGYKILIDAEEIKTIHAFGAEVFRKKLIFLDKKVTRLNIMGKMSPLLQHENLN